MQKPRLTTRLACAFACCAFAALQGRADAQGCQSRIDCINDDDRCQKMLDYLTCIASDKQVFGITGSGMCEQYGSEYNKLIAQCANLCVVKMPKVP